MTQKAVLITGGARRVGAELARGFVKQGYDVALHYHQSKDEAEALAGEIGAKLYQGNLTDEGAAKKLIEQTTNDLPYLNMLINNASTFRRAHLKDTTEQTIEQDIAINLLAPMNLMREFAAKVEKGNIINLLDRAIHDSHPAHFAYLVAKKGLGEATKMAAREYLGKMRVNAICPGHLLPTEGDAGHEPTPLPNKPTVEQVVQAALLLAESDAYTGQFLNIDGGESVL